MLPRVDPVPPISPYDPVERYGLDLRPLADALAPIAPLIERFYPDFSQRWSAGLRPDAGPTERTGR